MNNKKINIDIYSTPQNKIVKSIKKIEEDLTDYHFSFYHIDDPPPPQKEIGSVIIVEETSSKEIVRKFINIFKSYKVNPFVIISSESPNYKNAVKWMKHYAVDYFDGRETFSKDDFIKRIKESIIFEHIDFVDSKDSNPFHYPPVQFNASGNWNTLKEENDYQMSIVFVSLKPRDEFIDKISKTVMDETIKRMEEYITKKVVNMGGKKFFWNYNTGAFLFHFGDRINLATLSVISIINKIEFFFLENLNAEKMIDFNFTLHDGEIFYKKYDSKFVTSDAINTAAHLTKRHDGMNTFEITENAYEHLNPRLKILFHQDDTFEGRQIYSYYLDFYKQS